MTAPKPATENPITLSAEFVEASKGEPHLPPSLAFTPVPRRTKRWNGLTADKQRAFIKALAQTGSVSIAAKVIGNAGGSLYGLKLAAGAESFAAAWDKAVHRGAGQILDILVDHAINGAPEYIYKDGVLVAERRVFNYRMMMWIVAHHMPDRFGTPAGLEGHGGSSKAMEKLKEQWRSEWEDERAGATRATEEDTDAAIIKKLHALKKSTWFETFLPWMDDPEKRAACDLLYGVQDWDAIRQAAARARYGGN